MQKVLFIDRDGTIIREADDEQIDSFDKLVFYPKVFTYLGKIARELDYKIVMVTNQDGLGSDIYPQESFDLIHKFILQSFENENVMFDDIFIDKTFARDNAPTRKPNTGMLTSYMQGDYDLQKSFVIGDRLTDMELAKNLGAKGIFINDETHLAENEITVQKETLQKYIALESNDWQKIYEFLKFKDRVAEFERKTNETDIKVTLNLDGTGQSDISTGIGFFDHMLEQIARHGLVDLSIKTTGDLHVDEHHTIEDTMIALGQAFAKALDNKIGIERYGFCLPMDDCLAQVAVDFGGRSWIEWNAVFKREKIGEMPAEMFFHLFKSFSDGAKCNLNVKAEGTNEHHKIEAIFKAFAKAIKMAITQDREKMILPTTKGTL